MVAGFDSALPGERPGLLEVEDGKQHREERRWNPDVRKDLNVGAGHAAPSSARISIVTMAKMTIISEIKG